MRGNYRKMSWAPTIGEATAFLGHCSGFPRSLSVRVDRAYTGPAISGALTLEVFEYAPVYAGETPLVVNLKEEGLRVALPFMTGGAQSGDSLAEPERFWGAFYAAITGAGWTGVFTSADTRSQLPIITFEFEFDDPITMGG